MKKKKKSGLQTRKGCLFVYSEKDHLCGFLLKKVGMRYSPFSSGITQKKTMHGGKTNAKIVCSAAKKKKKKKKKEKKKKKKKKKKVGFFEVLFFFNWKNFIN